VGDQQTKATESIISKYVATLSQKKFYIHKIIHILEQIESEVDKMVCSE
jgi:hypothetical protein